VLDIVADGGTAIAGEPGDRSLDDVATAVASNAPAAFELPKNCNTCS